jgi:hypothetical protein
MRFWIVLKRFRRYMVPPSSGAWAFLYIHFCIESTTNEMGAHASSWQIGTAEFEKVEVVKWSLANSSCRRVHGALSGYYKDPFTTFPVHCPHWPGRGTSLHFARHSLEINTRKPTHSTHLGPEDRGSRYLRNAGNNFHIHPVQTLKWLININGINTIPSYSLFMKSSLWYFPIQILVRHF